MRTLCPDAATAALVCLLAAVAAAQPPAPPALQATPRERLDAEAQVRASTAALARAEAGDPGAKETEAETVARCLKDLQSEDPQVRHRAVLVLGKYQQPQAQAAVIGCLKDPVDRVRQAALVSLLEGDFMPPAAREAVARLLLDPNVQIRRLASSACRDLLMPGFMIVRGGTAGDDAGGTDGAAASPGADVMPLINKALLDEDAIVRKNVLTYCLYAQGRVDPAALEKNLAFPDKEIRVLAMRALAQALLPKPALLLARLQPLAEDKEAVVREEVARSLARCGQAAREPLRTLAADSDPGVRIAALEGLCNLQDPLVLERVVPLMKEEAVPVADKKRLLWSLPMFGEAGIRKLVELTQGTPLAIQAEALRMAAAYPNTGLTVAFFLPFLDSRPRELRTAAASAMMRFQKELTPDQLRQLCASKFPEVRTTGLQLCLRLPRDEAAGVVGDFLLDDDVDIRTMAMMYANHLRIPDWQTVLKQSLEDGEERVREAGAAALLGNPDPESRQILETYLKEKPAGPVADFIRERLPQAGQRRVMPPAASPQRLLPGGTVVRPTRTTPVLLPARPQPRPAAPPMPAAPAPAPAAPPQAE